ncbi:MAG: O-antigen ligase family protein [Desulfobacteraceae bacterium]|nr:O-antigen ligase family protein [Desulfobacteraceae bacterium]
MKFFKKYLSQTSPDDAVFWSLTLVFLLLPTGTAPPLIALGLTFAVWLFSGRFTQVGSVIKQSWFFPVILFVLLPWIGLTYSRNLDLGMDYAMKTQYWIAALITAGCCMSDKRLFIFVCALWTGLFAGAALALVQFLGLAVPIKAAFLGFGIVHTLISMYLLVGILMAAFYFKRVTTRQGKIVLVLLILAFIFHLTVLEGRSGYLIFVLVSPLIAWDLGYGLPLIGKLVICAVLVSALFLSPVVKHRVVNTVTKLETNKEKALEGENIKGMPRFYMANLALGVIKQHPVTGVGTGSLVEVTGGKGYGIEHPHNNFLYMGASFGILGIISLIWLFWNMFARSWRVRKTPLGYFVFSTCLVLFLGGMFDTQILNTGTLLFLTITYGFLNHLEVAGKGNT